MQLEAIKAKKGNDTWFDESGLEIPYGRVSPVERLQERSAAAIFNKAMRLHNQLQAYKKYVIATCEKVHNAFMEQAKNENSKANKGNYTWFNFDRSLKIEISINERIAFDDLGIKASKEKLDLFLDNNVSSENEFIKQLVLDSFSTSRGTLDAKKVMNLIRYKSKIDNPLFLEAIQLLEDSIRRPDSKTYFRVWVLTDEGKYESIDLNFSSI